MIAIPATSLIAGSVKLLRPASGTACAEDPGAPGGRCLAIRIEEQPGDVVMPFQWPGVVPGLYEVKVPIRLQVRPGFSAARLQLKLAFGESTNVWLTCRIAPGQLDGTPGAWTVLTRPVILQAPSAKNTLSLSWRFKEDSQALKTGKASKPAFEIKLPDVDDADAMEPAKNQAAPAADLLSQIDSDTLTPVAKMDYPAILVGDPVMEPVSTTLIVEKVWPEKIHIYPGGTNPVAVTIRNFTDQAVETSVRLEMKTGLDETAAVGEKPLRVPARDTATLTFPWVAGTREYGYGAAATLLVNGGNVHSNAEYFSVSMPIWKTAIQGSGFLIWHGREDSFAEHVESTRRAYCNVEEAFSWQPSSWTDLNPTNQLWFTGQGDACNSLAGLREWFKHSHSNGIKLITYSWASISGKPGFDWGRRFPDILCREKGGIPQTDEEDLDLSAVTAGRPELWRYRSGQWLSNFVNLGLLRAIHHHAMEVIRSSRSFGWDGIRFDYPPGWSGMGTADVQKEFEILGVKDVMKELMPEYYNTTSSTWSGKAITARNVRYFQYIFKKELGEQFALSYNGGGYSPLTTNQIEQFTPECKGGGQVMDEAIRNCGSLTNYMQVALWHSEGVRQLGGYSCVFKAEACAAPMASAYSGIFTFAAGTHPYGDYGWSGSMPGKYSQFMTRYGEYCWDLALVPVTPAQAGVTVESKTPLLWEQFIRQRRTNDLLQTVVHLIASPEGDPAKALKQAQVEWSKAITVRKQCRSQPDVWLLTAEPELKVVRLQPERRGQEYAVIVPDLRLWSFLVWSEKP